MPRVDRYLRWLGYTCNHIIAHQTGDWQRAAVQPVDATDINENPSVKMMPICLMGFSARILSWIASIWLKTYLKCQF